MSVNRGPLIAASAIAVLDQLTKAWAVAGLTDGPVRLLGDLLQLRLARNPGGAFSVLTGFTPILALAAAAIAIVLVRSTRRTTDKVMAYSLAAVLGGALGNLVDRLVRHPGFLRGEVVDFVDLSFWPTFNLADSAITVGVIFVVLRGWKH